MKALKKLWNIVTGKDKNWDGSVDIKDKMISAKQKTLPKQLQSKIMASKKKKK